MPVTPFHLGPGLAVKAVAGHRFSLMVFGFSQVVMDIEPVVRLVRGHAIVHGFTHTYLGAALVSVVCIIVGRPICQVILRSVRLDPHSAFLTWLFRDTRISWGAAVAGASVGTFSHVFLDSLMHSDMSPLAPFVAANSLLNVITMESVHVACVVSGVLGLLLVASRYFARRAGES